MSGETGVFLALSAPDYCVSPTLQEEVSRNQNNSTSSSQGLHGPRGGREGEMNGKQSQVRKWRLWRQVLCSVWPREALLPESGTCGSDHEGRRI